MMTLSVEQKLGVSTKSMDKLGVSTDFAHL